MRSFRPFLISYIQGRVDEIAYLPSLDVLHDFLLSCNGSLVTTVGVSILFSEDKGYEVNPRPSLFPL
jgi:hypothetical protein